MQLEHFKLRYTRSKRQKLIMTIAAFLVFVTTYALILPAITIDIDTAENEPGMSVDSEGLYLPALSINKDIEDTKVSIDAKDGVFPEGTTMSLSKPKSDGLRYLLESAVKGTISKYEAIGVEFKDGDGNKVEPHNKYDVKIITDFLKEYDGYKLVQVSGDKAKVIKDSEFTYKQVKFTSDAQTAFAMVEMSDVQSKYLTASSGKYEVKLTYDYKANIKDGSTLEVKDIAKDSFEYQTAMKSFGAEQSEETLFEDMIDITIRDSGGKEIEPEGAVSVSVTRKNLPDSFDSRTGGLTVQHLNETGKNPVVENMDSASVVQAGALTASFSTNSFSTYYLQWRQYGTSGSTRTVNVHYGYMRNGSFVEFPSGTPAQVPDFHNNNTYGTSVTSAFLIYDIPGYQYSSTHLNSSTGTAIGPRLTYANNTWRYSSDLTLNYNRSWTNLANGNNIYVVYEPMDDPVPGGHSKIFDDGYETPEEPEMHKRSDNNHDGTRTITLSVDGHSTPIDVEKLADVIVVYDNSDSMNGSMGDGWASNVPVANRRLTYATNAFNELADELLSEKYLNRDGRPLIRMSLVTFNTTAQVKTLSQSDQAYIEEDGSYWQKYPDYEFTSVASKYKGLLPTSATGGTNWEQALQLANRMDVDPDRETYIIFMTDGEPTFRVSRTPAGADPVTDSTLTSDTYSGYSYGGYTRYNVYGEGNNDSNNYNYLAAVNEAKSIVEQGKQLYCIGVSDDVKSLDQFVKDAGAGDDHSYSVYNEDQLHDALSNIVFDIQGHAGYSDIKVTDGITTMTNLVAKAKVVGVSDEIKYRKIVKDDDGNVIRTLEDWDPTSEGCNKAEYNPETGALEWNMGENFQLKDNTTYEVYFKVWPNQHAFDIVTQLNNGEITLNDLTEEERSQIAKETSGDYTVYTLKTNTDVGMSYTHTRESTSGNLEPVWDEPKYVVCEDEVDPLVMQTMDLQVSKTFADSFGDETGDGIGADRPEEVVLYLETRPVGGSDSEWEPVNLFAQPDGSLSNKIVLNDGNNWRSTKFYVAPGLVDKDKITREVGHEFRVLEPDIDYHYELDGEVINPLLEGHENDNDPNLNYDKPLQVVKEVYVVKQYNGDTDDSLDLSALNVVKGGISLFKNVEDASGNLIYPNEAFTFQGWILDPDGNPYIFDPANDDRTDKSKKADSSTPLFAAHQNDPIPYHFYNSSGQRTIYKGHFADTSNIIVSVRAGEQIRFPIVPIGSTFCFWEVDGNGMPTGYVLKSAEGVLQENVADPVTGTTSFVNSADTSKYPTTDSENRINGQIYGNALSKLVFTNRRVEPGKLVVRKDVVKSDLRTKIYPDETFTFTGYIRERYYYWGYRYRGYSLQYNIRNKDGEIVSSGTNTNTYDVSFNLKAGEYIEFLNVPEGAYYEFAESTSGMSADYTFVGAEASAASSTGASVTQPSVANNGSVSGRMQANQEHNAVFTNRINRDPVSIQIIKVYAKDQTERINNVSFMLYSDAQHNTPATDYQGNEIGVITTGGFADEEETQPLGFARIGDLWPGSYYLVETVTPAGYRPPSDHMVITVGNDGSVTLTDPDNASATGTGYVTETDGLITVAIPNTKYSDAVLPRTGGIGSTLFYISGGLLITAAAVIYIFCFRRRKGGRMEPDFLK